MNRMLGIFYALVTAALLAAQPPFSASAAKTMSPVEFVFLTEIGLAVSIPLLLLRRDSRRACFALLREPSQYWKLGVILAAGAAAIALYSLSLAGSSPVVVAAILNVAPFWAALVALVLAKRSIPVSPVFFFAVLAAALAGATAVAWSQEKGHGFSAVAGSLARGTWLFALPIPLFTTLSASLMTRWYTDRDQSGVVAANVIVGALILIPATLALLVRQGASIRSDAFAAGLMIVGVILADSVGRVFYQKALKVTDNDNGFVTMFQNLGPALAAALTFALSFLIAGLAFRVNLLFFAGLGVTVAALFLLSIRALAQEKRAAAQASSRAVKERLPGLLGVRTGRNHFQS